jgi:hypothetical protein
MYNIIFHKFFSPRLEIDEKLLSDFNRARSAVGKAQGLVKGSGFDPDLFHKAFYVPFTCRWRFEIKLEKIV